MTDTTTTDTAAPAATDQPAPASGGLLDAASPVDDKAAKAEDPLSGTGSHLAEDPTAKAAAAEQAKRERPDWLPEKFWDKDKRDPKLDAMAKSYAELEKNVMSVAEKLKAEGRVEGQEKGLWIGKIQTLEEFLACPVSSHESLDSLSTGELEARHRVLHLDYEARFKR